jgi:hypothetical protein
MNMVKDKITTKEEGEMVEEVLIMNTQARVAEEVETKDLVLNMVIKDNLNTKRKALQNHI